MSFAARNLIFSLFMLSMVSVCFSQIPAHTVLIETGVGDMTCILYEETPMHAENFVKLAGEGYFDGQLFHRVIHNFMIQTGDPGTKSVGGGQAFGSGGPGYTIPGEFHPALFHKKGALAAARQVDNINPNRESSGSQFYIVQGKQITNEEMDRLEASGSHIKFTPLQREIYKSQGGTPHLDYAYTVFGEVIKGLDVIDRIASVPTGNRDRPVDDIRILKVSVLN